MLQIKNLKKAYGKYPALDGLSMEVKEGTLFGFVGPNGAGKTTTIKILMGLLKADGGSVLIDGMDAMKNQKEVKGKIGYVPDVFGVYDNLKVREYMEFFASCYGMEGLMARKRCNLLLEQVGLEERTDFYVDGLSRGMKQRLCLARALIHDPKLLILDEPASGLDPRTRLEFRELLIEQNDRGKTIFISSHVLSELNQMCSDIGIIDQGRMIVSGNIREITERVDQSNPLIIRVYQNMEKAMAILRSHSCVRTISIKDNCLSVGFAGDNQDEALLLQQMIDAEVLVNGFFRKQGSLESLFMQITDHEEKEELLYEGKPGL
ncbi:MAG: ABC transporter ATP-binding protein [Lachnospiraceae bacterium]|nr:ABC transporter ATP-binding protein [Lachnospiraceae bacterium]